MTRSAGVAEQLVVATNIMTGRARESAPQAESGIAQEDLGGEFSELLTKLKGGGEQASDDPAAMAQSKGTAPAEWKEAPQRVRESWVGEELAAGDGRPAGDTVEADATIAEVPSKTGTPDVPAAAAPNANVAAAEGIAAMLTLTSGRGPTATAQAVSGQPPANSQPAQASLPTQRAASSNAILEAALEPEKRPAAPAAPAAAHVDGKGSAGEGEMRFGPAAAALAFASPSESAKVPMGGVVVASANDPLKANVLRQEAHFPPVAPATMEVRSGAAQMEGGKLGTGSESKRNDSAAPLVDTMSAVDPGLIAADPATGVAPSPTQQIADRLIAGPGAFDVVDRVSADPSRAGAKPVLKVLQIQLQPAELGTVTVRMELGPSGLELQVEAASAETAEMLRADKDTLSNLMRSSGYAVDASSIRVVEADRTAASPQTNQQGAQPNLQSSTQSQYGGAERDARAYRGHEGSSGGEAPAQSNRTESHETNASRIGGGLYI